MTAAMNQVTGRKDCAALLRLATDPKFGDYQANGVMALAKQLKTNPRELAQKVVDCLELEDICEPPEIAGPGFINLRLKTDFIASMLLDINANHERLGIDKTNNPQRIVVDFSAPNIAKQMHVGHLRSTIIGDAICRLLEFEGHTVIRQNHIGNWGRQFGRAFLGLWHICMGERRHGGWYHLSEFEELRVCSGKSNQYLEICTRIRNRHEEDWRTDSLHEIGDGENFFGPFVRELHSAKRNPPLELEDSEQAYQYVSQLEESLAGLRKLEIPTRRRDPQTNQWIEEYIPYGNLSRRITEMLQEGGEDNRIEQLAWEFLVDQTMKMCDIIYKKLNVTLDQSHVRGESAYNDKLPSIVEDLKKASLAVESDGAICVFPEGFQNKQGNPLPFIIQKSKESGESGGGYLYATTDLAAIRYRVDELKADKIIYVTDFRQSQHFAMLFATARTAGWVPSNIALEHVSFGTMLGEDGKPFKTRSGGTVKLRDLLEEAVQRARTVVEEKNPDLDEDTKHQIARAVGIGAVKYADYSTNRNSDYIFSFDRMLSLEGNTAPYMQYAYARVKSIERKAAGKDVDIEAELTNVNRLVLDDPAELDLAKHLIRYGEAIESASQDCRPNYLTQYLYDLAQKFSSFYNACPVLDAGPEKRPTRLMLCDLTARTIRHGLTELLGIEVVEQM
ncbi:MAG: arginine--tRNA ligase [Sedimentisphaerales bacterium]|nr:arginine--tRNA ligase [Sedimentisphaerales bacterium]